MTTDQDALRAKVGKLPKAIEKQGWNTIGDTDPKTRVIINKNGESKPVLKLRDNENAPLSSVSVTWGEDSSESMENKPHRRAVKEYVKQEVLFYVPDVWVDHDETKIGYEIPLTLHFHKYVLSGPLNEVNAELKQLEVEINELLREVTDQ